MAAEQDCHRVRRELEGVLHDDFGIDHTTPQIDHETDNKPLQIAPALRAAPHGTARNG